MAKKTETKKEEVTNLRRTLQGEVVKVSGVNTVSVRVESKYPHPKYGKIIKSHKKYTVDTNDKEAEIGNVVLISETRPKSKTKSWEITEIVK